MYHIYQQHKVTHFSYLNNSLFKLFCCFSWNIFFFTDTIQDAIIDQVHATLTIKTCLGYFPKYL